MYMRNYLAPEVLPDELPQEKVEEACKNIFDSHYYLQPSVGLEALYYKAAIELLQ